MEKNNENVNVNETCSMFVCWYMCVWCVLLIFMKKKQANKKKIESIGRVNFLTIKKWTCRSKGNPVFKEKTYTERLILRHFDEYLRL